MAPLFGWGLSPQLGVVRCSEPQDPQADIVLLLGWGGSTAEQLEAPRCWWHEQGCKTVVTTRGAFDVESQVAAVMAALPAEGPLLVHAFSNNGLYMWCDLQHRLAHRAVGVVIDSAPDPSLDEVL